MTPLQTLKQAEGMRLEDRNGHIADLRLLPPLTTAELADLEAGIPCPLPEEARELLAHCRGFDLPADLDLTIQEISFAGLEGGFGLEEVFPHAVSIAHDGAGNYWVLDLTSVSTTWGPIFYACHDAPVIIFQSADLAHFIGELLRVVTPPWQSEISEVLSVFESRIWRENPGVVSHAECLASGDPDLIAFASSLDDSFLFVDLRKPRLGDGFSWGRYGASTVNRRFGEKRLFAYQQRKSLWQRFTGRLSV